ncbi:MAG: AAA family ATPase, partial [Bacteroidetes bacterium]|nr:AAA family ATPase [Bacteroidota bacterium]
MEPTEEQIKLIHNLARFTVNLNDNLCFVLTGYAGTGKTSILGAYVKSLSKLKVKVRLMAPTGRAAKVLSQKSGRQAITIHKMIYRRAVTADGSHCVTRMPNLMKNTVFVVDEASMIGDFTMQNDGSVSGNNLLDDLIEFVFGGIGCKLILLGDEGQLPPVGSDESPALAISYLKNHYPALKIGKMQLEHVLRQAENSAVLFNATLLRSAEEYDFPKFQIFPKGDLVRLSGEDTQDQLEQSYGDVGKEETIVITRSNKRANAFNNHIRSQVLWFEEELCSGDLLMCVKNNYHWMGDDSSMGFIANGEMFRVDRVLKRLERYGFQFALVRVRFVDYPDEVEKELYILTDTLQSEGPNLTREDSKRLFFAIEEDYMDEKNKRKRYD